MGAVFEREVGATDAADAGAGARKFLGVPGALRGAVVAGCNHLAVPHDDASHFSAGTGAAQCGGVGGVVGEGNLGRGGIRMGDRRRAEADREDIAWLVHLSNSRNVQYSSGCSRLAATIP